MDYSLVLQKYFFFIIIILSTNRANKPCIENSTTYAEAVLLHAVLPK
jgi:hypothetical protein